MGSISQVEYVNAVMAIIRLLVDTERMGGHLSESQLRRDIEGFKVIEPSFIDIVLGKMSQRGLINRDSPEMITLTSKGNKCRNLSDHEIYAHELISYMREREQKRFTLNDLPEDMKKDLELLSLAIASLDNAGAVRVHKSRDRYERFDKLDASRTVANDPSLLSKGIHAINQNFINDSSQHISVNQSPNATVAQGSAGSKISQNVQNQHSEISQEVLKESISELRSVIERLDEKERQMASRELDYLEGQCFSGERSSQGPIKESCKMLNRILSTTADVSQILSTVGLYLGIAGVLS